MRLFHLAPLVLLAACGTPQEQCIRLGARDLFVMDRLIAETQATIERGYALEEYEVDHWVWVDCGHMVTGPDGQPSYEPDRCLENFPMTKVRPKAVDLAAERRKLAGMVDKRRELAQAAAPVIAACKAKYPE